MNLQRVYLDIVRKFFNHLDNIPACRLSQGQIKDKRSAIVFGTYNARKNEIRIHPILLAEETPPIALEFVIYHEMLHFEDRAYLLRRKKGEGVHTKSFHLRERAFPSFKEAKTELNRLFKEGVPRQSLPRTKLRGEALTEALHASLQRLDEVMGRYGLVTVPLKKTKPSKGENNE